MIQIDVEHNAFVQQRFTTNCLVLTNRIIALQSRNEQISLKLQALMEKNQARQAKWLDVLYGH